MPGAADLPEALRPLAVHQAIDLRDAHFHADADQLIDLLQATVPGLGAKRWQGTRRWLIPALVALLVAAGVAAGLGYRDSRTAAAAGARKRAVAQGAAGKWAGNVQVRLGRELRRDVRVRSRRQRTVRRRVVSATSSRHPGRQARRRPYELHDQITDITERQDLRGHAPLPRHGGRKRHQLHIDDRQPRRITRAGSLYRAPGTPVGSIRSTIPSAPVPPLACSVAT